MFVDWCCIMYVYFVFIYVLVLKKGEYNYIDLEFILFI